MNIRNKTCRCGSEKKYKKCHLQADEVFDIATYINKRMNMVNSKPNSTKLLALDIMLQESIYFKNIQN